MGMKRPGRPGRVTANRPRAVTAPAAGARVGAARYGNRYVTDAAMGMSPAPAFDETWKYTK